MGQSFMCVNIDKQEKIESDGFFKLTESAWIGNDFVETVEALLSKKWKNDRIVWAGQYMDEGLFLPDGISDDINLYEYAEKNYLTLKPAKNNSVCQFIANSTTKQFIDKNKVRGNDGWSVHPLPIITASGNGNGGGDYHPVNEHDAAYVGIWAGQRIFTTNEAPANYEEIVPDFFE